MFQGWQAKGISTTASTQYSGTIVRLEYLRISSVGTISSQVIMVCREALAMFSALPEKPIICAFPLRSHLVTWMMPTSGLAAGTRAIGALVYGSVVVMIRGLYVGKSEPSSDRVGIYGILSAPARNLKPIGIVRIIFILYLVGNPILHHPAESCSPILPHHRNTRLFPYASKHRRRPAYPRLHTDCRRLK